MPRRRVNNKGFGAKVLGSLGGAMDAVVSALYAARVELLILALIFTIFKAEERVEARFTKTRLQVATISYKNFQALNRELQYLRRDLNRGLRLKLKVKKRPRVVPPKPPVEPKKKKGKNGKKK